MYVRNIRNNLAVWLIAATAVGVAPAAMAQNLDACDGVYAGTFEGDGFASGFPYEFLADATGTLETFVFTFSWMNTGQDAEADFSGADTMLVDFGNGHMEDGTPGHNINITTGGQFVVTDCSMTGGWGFVDLPLVGTGTWSFTRVGDLDTCPVDGPLKAEHCQDAEEEEEEDEEEPCELPLSAGWQEPGGGEFSNPDHWAIDDVPGAGFTVLFAEDVVNGGAVTMDNDHTSEALVVRDDVVSLELLAIRYLLNGPSECVSSLDIGFLADPNPDIPTSKLTVGGGQIDAQSVVLGGDAGTTGRLRLDFTDFNSATSCAIGGDGEGILEVVEGAVFHGADVQLARNVFAEGFAVVAGRDSKMLIDDRLVVGGLGSALLDVVEGAMLELLDGAELIIGEGSGSDGTVIISDQDTKMTGEANVTLGEQSDSSGSLEVFDEGVKVTAGVIVVGKSGQGEIHVADQARLDCKQLTLAADEGSQGDVLVEGVGQLDTITAILVDQFTVIAETGTASLTIRNGGGVIGGTGAGEQVASSIAATLGSRGTVIVEGEGALWGTKVLNVGFAGTGEMFIRDKGLVTSVEAVVGNTEGAIGDVEITSGGTWEIEGRLIMAAEGSIGRIHVSGESFLIADEIIVGPLAVLTGNFILIGPDGEGAPISLRLQSQDLETPGIFTNRLVIEQGGIIEAEQITLGPGGELAGDGDLDVDLLNTGTLSPGLDECTTGVFSINGDYTQDSTATLRIKLGGRTLGDTHDTLLVNGVAELAGELHIDAINDFVPQPGDSFEILTADSVSGAFDSIEGSGEYEAVYENNRVLLTVRVSPTEVAATCGEPEEVITQPSLCGAGLCGSGMVPIAPLMVFGLGLLRLTNSRRPR